MQNAIDKFKSEVRKELGVQSNADRIRAMSDEELAEFFIHTRTNCEICNCLTNECLMDCSNGILEWLQSEVDTKGE